MPLVLRDPKLLWRRYVVAVTAVASLLVASHLAARWAIEGGEEAASVVNLSGRQRMLSQRILFLTATETSTEGALSEAVDLFARSHDALMAGGAFGLTAEGARARAPIYAASEGGETLDDAARRFLRDARLAEAGGPEGQGAGARLAERGGVGLLARLDAATRALEAQARDRTVRMRRVSDATLAAALLILALEALFIFWPAQRTVERALDRTQQALREAEAARLKAERAASARTAFLANMSHELRTPLNGIMGMLSIAQREPSSKTQTEQLGIAASSAEHLLALLNDILDFSRFESGKMTFEAIPTRPLGCAQEIAALLAGQAAEKGLALTVEATRDVPAFVVSDPTRLRQVMTNLVGNAIKFTEAGGVTVSLSATGPEGARTLRVAVTDTGIGLTPEATGRLFTRFEQADSSTTRRYGGTGLGLAICRQITEQMGGAIGCDSEPGRGSTFWFTLPLREATPAGARAARTREPEGLAEAG